MGCISLRSLIPALSSPAGHASESASVTEDPQDVMLSCKIMIPDPYLIAESDRTQICSHAKYDWSRVRACIHSERPLAEKG
jgi:hypothetical protein